MIRIHFIPLAIARGSVYNKKGGPLRPPFFYPEEPTPGFSVLVVSTRSDCSKAIAPQSYRQSLHQLSQAHLPNELARRSLASQPLQPRPVTADDLRRHAPQSHVPFHRSSPELLPILTPSLAWRFLGIRAMAS